MRKMVLFFLVILMALVVHYFSLISYGIGQASGQLKIVWQAEAIDKYLADPAVPDSIRDKLDFIQEVRQFAVDDLGLNESDNYKTIYDQHGKPALWVVTGCKPYAFEPKEWKFPILGSVPYKGFFVHELAQEEMLRVKEEGFDAGIRTVGGWSTLGWFKDPILSEMLIRSKGDLANLIIHELVHATVFVRDSIDFNENLASFIADKGTFAFMQHKYGENSYELKQFLADEHDSKLYVTHILNGVDTLEHLYHSLEDKPVEIKKAKKQRLIEKIINTTDTIPFDDPGYVSFLKGQLPNNTYFMSFLRYRSKQDALELLFTHKFNKEIKPFVGYMKRKYPYL